MFLGFSRAASTAKNFVGDFHPKLLGIFAEFKETVA
jgi:hypothetical protein